MNWLDQTVGFFSPRAGLRRARARAAMNILCRGYEGAKLGRRTEGWRAPGSGSNAEIAAALPRLRDRSRDLVLRTTVRVEPFEEVTLRCDLRRYYVTQEHRLVAELEELIAALRRLAS